MATRLPVVMVNGQLQQLQTADALPLFSAAVQGEVPASGSATGTKVIFDDGVWRVPSGGGVDLDVPVVSDTTIPASKHRYVADELEIIKNNSVMILDVTATPSTYTAGNWPKTTMETGKWQIAFTPSRDSTHLFFIGSSNMIAMTDDGLGPGGVSKGLYLAAGGMLCFADGVTSSGPGNAITFKQQLSWIAGDRIVVTIDNANKLVGISGAKTGNGLFTFSGPFSGFNGTTLGIGTSPTSDGSDNFTGTIEDIFDGAQSHVFLEIGAGGALEIG